MMNITNAKYLQMNGQNAIIEFTVDGVIMHVSSSASDNRHYIEIMRQVEAGELIIQDAD